MHAHTHMLACIQTHTHMCTQAHSRTHPHTYTHVRTHPPKPTHTHTPCTVPNGSVSRWAKSAITSANVELPETSKMLDRKLRGPDVMTNLLIYDLLVVLVRSVQLLLQHGE